MIDWHLTLKIDMMFNVACINTCTTVEGPGRRLAIWFQGCNKQCDGCCNPQFIPLVPKHLLTLSEINQIIYESKEVNDIEGITYLGGEPTLQKGLPQLSRAAADIGLGVILFTGNPLNELNPTYLENVDLVIDGPYIEKQRDLERNLIGSVNQKIICLTERYENCLDWFLDKRIEKVEVNIDDGLAVFSGDVV